jgi:hypothetical protein
MDVTRTQRTRAGAGLLVAGLATLLVVGACGGGSDDLGDAGESADDGVAALERDADAPAPAPGDQAFATGSGGDAAEADQPELRRPAVISTGTVSLTSPDAAKARLEVQQVVDRFRGTVAEEETVTDDGGEVEMARLVLRVPSDSFDEAMQALEGIGDLQSTTSGSEDVTTQVIDNEARIRAQTKSLERVEALLARAEDLQEIVAIETQLTRRQAELDSLKAQQAWLTDQTSLATISVHIEKAPGDDEGDEAGGFLGGLADGWRGLVAVLSGAATAFGFLLPFAGALLLVGVPLWLLLRSLRGRGTAAPAEPAD